MADTARSPWRRLARLILAVLPEERLRAMLRDVADAVTDALVEAAQEKPARRMLQPPPIEPPPIDELAQARAQRVQAQLRAKGLV